jgi:hypothetical protein
MLNQLLLLICTITSKLSQWLGHWRMWPHGEDQQEYNYAVPGICSCASMVVRCKFVGRLKLVAAVNHWQATGLALRLAYQENQGAHGIPAT